MHDNERTRINHSPTGCSSDRDPSPCGEGGGDTLSRRIFIEMSSNFVQERPPLTCRWQNSTGSRIFRVVGASSVLNGQAMSAASATTRYVIFASLCRQPLRQ